MEKSQTGAPVERLKGRVRRRALGIAVSVAGPCVLTMATCARPSPEPYITLLQSQQSAVREKAAGKLLGYGDEVVPRLIQEVGSGYTTSRFESVRLLGRLRDRRAVPILIHALDDRSATVAALAAWGLGEMRVAEAVPALLPYTGEIARELRAEVIRALGLCYDPEGLPASTADSVHAAILAAFDDEITKVRIAALQSMHEFGYRDALDQVIQLSRDGEPEVRYVAVQALGQLGSGRVPRSPGAAQGLERDLIVKALLHAIAEPRQSIRTKVVRSLEMMEAEEAIPTLRVLEHGTEEDRREARRVLEVLGVAAPSQT